MVSTAPIYTATITIFVSPAVFSFSCGHIGKLKAEA